MSNAINLFEGCEVELRNGERHVVTRNVHRATLLTHPWWIAERKCSLTDKGTYWTIGESNEHRYDVIKILNPQQENPMTTKVKVYEPHYQFRHDLPCGKYLVATGERRVPQAGEWLIGEDVGCSGDVMKSAGFYKEPETRMILKEVTAQELAALNAEPAPVPATETDATLQVGKWYHTEGTGYLATVTVAESDGGFCCKDERGFNFVVDADGRNRGGNRNFNLTKPWQPRLGERVVACCGSSEPLIVKCLPRECLATELTKDDLYDGGCFIVGKAGNRNSRDFMSIESLAPYIAPPPEPTPTPAAPTATVETLEVMAITVERDGKKFSGTLTEVVTE